MKLLLLKHRLFVASSLVIILFSFVNADEVQIETRSMLILETSYGPLDESSVGLSSNRSRAGYESNNDHLQRSEDGLASGSLPSDDLNSLWRTSESFLNRTTGIPDFDSGETALATEAIGISMGIGADPAAPLGGPTNMTLLICGLAVMLIGSALFYFQIGRKPRQRRNVYR